MGRVVEVLGLDLGQDREDGIVVQEERREDRLLGLTVVGRDAIADAGRPLVDPSVCLRAATRGEILVRVLTNLKQIFLSRGDLAGALACVERILLLAPEDPIELRDREALRARVRVH